MRLFTGLDLPAEVAGNLEQLLRQLRPAARIDWSPPANLHITTKFIGEWPEERLGGTAAARSAALPARPPIPVHIRKVGFFPNPHSPRVFWCGIEAPGLTRTGRRYRPRHGGPGHRARETRLLPASHAGPHQGEAGPATSARGHRRPALARFGSSPRGSFFLYRSQLRPTGSVYTKLAEFPFSK